MAELRIDQTRSVIRNGQTNITFRPPRHYTLAEREREMILLSLVQSVSYFFLHPPLKTAWARNNSLRAIGKWFFRRRAKSIGPDCKLETIGECHDEIEPLSVSRAVEKLLRGGCDGFFSCIREKDQTFALLPQEKRNWRKQLRATKGFGVFCGRRNAKC